MNPFEMVVLIVAIVCFAKVAKTRRGWRADDAAPGAGAEDAARLPGEVRRLRDRIAVLERIVTDGDRERGLALEREIEALRDARRDRALEDR